MKKVMFGLVVLLALSSWKIAGTNISINPSRIVYESDGDARYADDGSGGPVITICPGTGAKCQLVLVNGNDITIIAGKKKAGGPDFIVTQ
jgi:hypothetical protein